MWHDRTTWSGSLTDSPAPPGWPGCWSISAPAKLWWRSLWITSAVHVRGDPLSWSCATRSQPRSDLPRDLPRSSSPWSPTGCWHGLRGSAVIGTPQLARVRPCEQGDAPRARATTEHPPSSPWAAAVLPGVQVRRLLFWRYLLRWRKPINRIGRRSSAGTGFRRSSSEFRLPGSRASLGESGHSRRLSADSGNSPGDRRRTGSCPLAAMRSAQRRP
jgi:hypothetical protein